MGLLLLGMDDSARQELDASWHGIPASQAAIGLCSGFAVVEVDIVLLVRKETGFEVGRPGCAEAPCVGMIRCSSHAADVEG